jgi:hypothetical protein
MKIKELAEQANDRFKQNWPGGVIWYWDELAKFAELVAAHEREECAKVCDAHGLFMTTQEIRARSKA